MGVLIGFYRFLIGFYRFLYRFLIGFFALFYSVLYSKFFPLLIYTGPLQKIRKHRETCWDVHGRNMPKGSGEITGHVGHIAPRVAQKRVNRKFPFK